MDYANVPGYGPTNVKHWQLPLAMMAGEAQETAVIVAGVSPDINFEICG